MGTIRIGSVNDDLGLTPPGWRPGAFGLAPGETTANRNLFLDAGGNTAYRINLDDIGSPRSLAELRKLIRDELNSVGPFFGKSLTMGVPTIFSNLAAMPGFLRANNSETKPPAAELPHMEQYAHDTALEIYAWCVANNVDTQLCLFSFGNESFTSGFFAQPSALLMRTFSAYQHGIRRAARELGVPSKVGGIEMFSTPDLSTLDRDFGYESATLEWLRYCKNPPPTDEFADGGIQIDFLVWHYFFSIFEMWGEKLLNQRDALRRAGFDPDTPQYLSEHTADGSQNLSLPGRDGEAGAACMILARRYQGALDRTILGSAVIGDNNENLWGIRGHCNAGIRFGTIADPTGWSGGSGLIGNTAGGTSIKKALWLVDDMTRRLGDRWIAHEITQDDENLGVSVMSTATEGSRFIILARCVGGAPGTSELPDATTARQILFRTYLAAKLGYRRSHTGYSLEHDELWFSTHLTDAERNAYIAGTSSGQIVSGALPSYFNGLPGALPGHLLTDDLAEAKAAAQRRYDTVSDTVSVSLEFADPGFVISWTGYRINSDPQNNPRAAFEATFDAFTSSISIQGLANAGGVSQVTATSHGLSNGVLVRIEDTGTALDGNRYYTSNVATNTFRLASSPQVGTHGAGGETLVLTHSFADAIAAAQAQQTLTSFGSGDQSDFPLEFDLEPFDTILLEVQGVVPFERGDPSMAVKYLDMVYSDETSAKSTPKQIQATITAISKANGAVVTAVNDFSNGDVVLITGVSGMTEINFLGGTVASASGTGFTLTEINSTGFTTYTSGGIARKVMTVTGHARLLYDDTKNQSELVDTIQTLKDVFNELAART